MNKKVFGILLSTFALLLVSCQNFLNGREASEQIKAAITYANSDYTLIKVKPQNGTGTVVKPAGGEAQQKPSDVFDLSFEPSADYEFVTWKVTSKKISDAADLQNYIKINDPDKVETTVTFKKPLDDIIITPVVVRRPKILSYSPIYTGSLSLKDTKIQVIFDKKMDRSSIYYSLDEINELKDELGLSDQDFLPENAVPGMTDIYGYKKNGEYIYKNILIKNNDEQTNINNRFSAPYFENPTTLIIPANRDSLPDAFSFISVSIDKSFCYEVEYENISKKIGLFESKDWVYQVNSQDDSIPPNLLDLEIQMKDEGEQKKDLQIQPSDTVFDNHKWVEEIHKLKEKKIYIKFKAADEGSGVAPYFDIVLDRFFDMKNGSQTRATTLKRYYTSIDRESYYEGEIDLTDYPDGVYTLSIILYDNNGNFRNSITTKPQGQNTTVDASAYFIIDENIYINEPCIEDEENPITNIKISWEPCWDLKSVDIKYKKTVDQNWTSIDQITNIFDGNIITSKIIDSLVLSTDYTFEIIFTDWYDHSKTFTKTYSTQEICKPTIKAMTVISNSYVQITYHFNRNPISKEKIYLVCSNYEDFSYDVKRYELYELNGDLLAVTFNYNEQLKDYSYFKICVYWEDDPNKYTSSARWRKSTAGTLHFEQR